MIQGVVVPLRNVGQLDVVAHTCSPSTMLFSWSSFFLTCLGHLQLKLFFSFLATVATTEDFFLPPHSSNLSTSLLLHV